MIGYLSKHSNIRNVLAIFGMMLSLLLSGCSSKFYKSKTVNLAPFAKQTITMIGTLHYDLTDAELLYLRDIKSYIDDPEPFKRYFTLEQLISRSFKGIVAYSLQVVSISEQNLPVAKKNQALADMLLKLRGFIIEEKSIKLAYPINKKSLAESIEKIKASESYLGALQHAQILINSYKANIGFVLDELKKEQKIVATMIDVAIDKKYGVSLEFEKELRNVRQRYYQALMLVSHYGQSKDKKLIAEMRALDIDSVNKILKNKNAPNRTELFSIYEAISKRLTMLNKNQEQVQPDIILYHKSHQELDKLLKHKLTAIKQARKTVIIWSQAHGSMAAGKSNPAEWFDVSETGGLLFDAAQNALGL